MTTYSPISLKLHAINDLVALTFLLVPRGRLKTPRMGLCPN